MTPFDSRRRMSDNHLVKSHIFVLALGLAACGKANDIPAMKAETEGMMKNYDARFEDLNRRAEAIMVRGNAIGVTSPDAQTASRLFATAKNKLDSFRNDIKSSSGELAKVKTQLELQKYIDRSEAKFEPGYIEINADFDSVESWITLAEQRPAQVSQRETPAVPPPPPAGTTGAGGTAPPPSE